MIEFALNYLTKHKLVPMPCMGEGDSKGKVPLIKWKDIQELPTEEQVREWFTKFPNANLGFKTGKVSGILVVDNDGVEIEEPLPVTPIVTSRPGHFHSYLKCPDFYIPPSTSKIGEHLDIRCDQGFVVAPPSKHFSKETGEVDGQYQWVKGRSPDDVEFAPCPEWLISKIKKATTQAYGFDWSTALNVGIGARDDTLKSAAASLVSRGFDQKTALAILRGINATYSPPLADNIVVNKLETAIRFIQKQRADDFTSPAQITPDIPIRERSVLSSVNLTPILSTELQADLTEIDWVWIGFLARGYITLFAALWKIGKSTLIALLLKALAEEAIFCGQITKRVNVLIVSEEGQGIWKRRIDEYNLNLPFWILCRPIKQKLNYNEWTDLLAKEAKFCEDNNVQLFILDTLSSFWNVDNENDAARVQAALLPINHLLEKQIAVLLIHHFRKSGGEEATASRGSGVLGSYADIIIEFNRMQGEPDSAKRVLKCYSRFEETPQEVVIELSEGEYTTLGTKSEVQKSVKLHKVLKMLEEFTSGATSTEIYDAWDEEELGKRPSERTIRRHLKTLVNTNQIKQVGEKEIGRTKASIYQKITPDNSQNNILSTDNKNSLNNAGQTTPLTYKDDHRNFKDPYPEGYWKSVPKDQWPQWKLDQETGSSS